MKLSITVLVAVLIFAADSATPTQTTNDVLAIIQEERKCLVLLAFENPRII